MSLTTVDQGLLGTYAQYTGFKNRLINGQMQIDQRNAGSSKTITSSATYYLDRWSCWTNVGSGQTIQQSSSAPSGFVNSTIITCGTGATPGATDYGRFVQNVEGFNTADFNWGTVNAKTVTVSFWVKSSLTGNFGVAFSDSANAYTYVGSYTINSANTWEYKTVTVPGPTSGSYSTTNGLGLTMGFDLGEGSSRSIAAGSWTSTASYSAYGLTGGVKVLATSGATWSVTGVQLEKGSTATSFDYRPYGTELALCQRYCLVGNWASDTTSGNAIYLGSGTQYTATNNYGVYTLPVTMRAAPSFSVSSASHWNLQVGGTSAVCTTVGINASNSKCPSWYVVTGTSFTTGYCGVVWANNASSMYTFSAEL